MSAKTEEEEIEAALDAFLESGGCGEHKSAAKLSKCCVVAFIANTEFEVAPVYPEELVDEDDEDPDDADDDEDPEEK